MDIAIACGVGEIAFSSKDKGRSLCRRWLISVAIDACDFRSIRYRLSLDFPLSRMIYLQAEPFRRAQRS